MFTPEIKLEKADERGEIYSIALPDGTEFMLIHSKQGVFRGGHSHNVRESMMLLTGTVKYYKTNGNVPINYIVVRGESSQNSMHMPHMAEFLDDSWLVEVKPGTPAHTSIETHYEPYRARVRDASLSNRG